MTGRRHSIEVAVQIVATLAAAGVVVVLLRERSEELQKVTELGVVALAWASVLTIANYAVGAVQLKELVRRFGSALSALESLLVVIAGYALNYLPMKAGTVAQGVALKTRWRVRLTHFGALSTASQLVSLWSAGTIAGVFALSAETPDSVAWALAIGPTVVLVALMAWGRMRGKAERTAPEGRWASHLFSAVHGLSELFADIPLLMLLIAVNLASVGLVAARLYVILRALGEPVSAGQAAIAGSFSIAAYIVGLLPGGLGFREGGIVGGAMLAGVDPGIALTAAVVDRGVDVLWVLLAGVPSAVWMGRAVRTRQESPS